MKFILLLLEAALACPCVFAQQAAPRSIQLPDASERWAIVIGVNHYDDVQINPNMGAVNDAKAIADALVQYAGFPKDHVSILLSDSPSNTSLKNSTAFPLPRRSEILKQLVALRRSHPAEGLLLFAFAGHGIQVDDDAYLLPMDAHYAEGNVDLLEDTGIKMSRLREYLSKTNFTQVIALFDACRNTPVMPGRPIQQVMGEPYKLSLDVGNHGIKAFAVLYATEKGFTSFENRQTQQGYFSQAFVEGLKGSAALGRDRMVTLSSLVRYIQTVVRERVRADFSAIQEPYAIIEGYKAEDLILSAHSDWLNPIDGQYYAEIPKGTLKMGCTGINHPQCTAKETPAPEIPIQQLRMGQTEVTVAAYRRFVDKSDSGLNLPPSPESFNAGWKDANQPIVNVAWNEAQRYCRWAGGRLPTEAEWEYAARGGTPGLEYPGGNTISHNDANYGQEEKCCKGLAVPGTTDQWVNAAPVGKFPPNGFHLLDMAGNVAEWVETPYPLPVEDNYVAKGGSWSTPSSSLRISKRAFYPSSRYSPDVGFRCVLPSNQ